MSAISVRQDQFDLESLNLIGDRYLLEVLEVDHTTKSGIFLPGQNEDTTGWQIGRVLKVGNGHRLEVDTTIPMFHAVGDVVLCERFSGRRFTIEGKNYVVMNQTSVFGDVRLKAA